MILGDTCTRHCGFCAVNAGYPGGAIDGEEPARLARAAAELALRHVVVTSVARDDLTDGGAGVFAECIRELRQHLPRAVIEVLTPDFKGDTACIDIVLRACPDIFNHNLETVERLTPTVRSKATYRQSLRVLEHARNASPSPTPLPKGRGSGLTFLLQGEGDQKTDEGFKTKSGIMLGLGETKEEILQALTDLRSVGCDYLTIGQYLQPSAKHLSIQQFVPIEDFKRWKETALALGFERVASGPLVRSSYFADELHGSSEVRRATPDVGRGTSDGR